MAYELLSKQFLRESIRESPLAMPYAVFLCSIMACVMIRAISGVLEMVRRLLSGQGSSKRSTHTLTAKQESLLRRENSIASSLSSTSASASTTSDVETESSSSFYSPHFSQARLRVTSPKTSSTAGYQRWCRMREAWLRSEEKKNWCEPGPFNYMEVYEALSQDKQHTDLPQRVKLGDILEVYQDIWDRGDLST